MQSTYYFRHPTRVDMGLAFAFLSPDVQAQDHSGKNFWLLNSITVRDLDMRGQGWGSRMLAHVVLDADREGATLFLGVDPMSNSPLSHRQLRSFYRRYGFSSHRPLTDINFMRRLPRGEADDASPEVRHARQRHEGCPLCPTTMN